MRVPNALPIVTMSIEEELIAAVVKDQQVKAKELLEQGVNVNWQEPETGISALNFAVTLRRHEMMDLFLAYQVNVNFPDKKLQTPLHWAVKESNLLAVEKLLKAGARTDLKDELGNTPSFYSQNEAITERLAVIEKEERAISKAARVLATVKKNQNEKGKTYFFKIPSNLAIKIASHCTNNLNEKIATEIARDNYKFMPEDYKLIPKPS